MILLSNTIWGKELQKHKKKKEMINLFLMINFVSLNFNYFRSPGLNHKNREKKHDKRIAGKLRGDPEAYYENLNKTPRIKLEKQLNRIKGEKITEWFSCCVFELF